MNFSKLTASAVLSLGLWACRGETTSEPPVHLIPNMDSQARFDPQAKTIMFADQRTMRPIPPGTVARGFAKEDDVFYRGKVEGTEQWVTNIPVEVTADFMARGQRKYTTYCQPCHSPTGDGNGMVAQRGFAGVANLQDARIRGLAAGEVYAAIGNGVRNMPGYAAQITENDRWAIVAYLKALQRRQNSTIEDVPEEQRQALISKQPK